MVIIAIHLNGEAEFVIITAVRVNISTWYIFLFIVQVKRIKYFRLDIVMIKKASNDDYENVSSLCHICIKIEM